MIDLAKNVEQSRHIDNLEHRGQTFGVNKAAEISKTSNTELDISSLGISNSESMIMIDDVQFDIKAKAKPNFNLNVPGEIISER